MMWRAVGLVAVLGAAAGVCSGQIPKHSLEIELPAGVLSESIVVRYVLAGEDFGGWVHPHAGISSIVIDTMRGSHPARGIKAILYAPGCAIQTLDRPLSASNNEPYSFRCRAIGSVWIAGTVTRADWLRGRDVKLQARYVARWAPAFLGLSADIVTAIPVGDAMSLAADGRFRIAVPDLSKDALAGAPNHASEIQIWAIEKGSEKIAAQLIPSPQWMKTPMGGLKIQTEYPEDTVFTVCSGNRTPVHDAFGFALREDTSNSCDR